MNDDQDARHSYEGAVRGWRASSVEPSAKTSPSSSSCTPTRPSSRASGNPDPAAASLRAHRRRRALRPAHRQRRGSLGGSHQGRFHGLKDYGGVHPNSAGYAFATGLVTAGLEQLLRRPVPKKGKLPPALDSASYDDPAKFTPGPPSGRASGP